MVRSIFWIFNFACITSVIPAYSYSPENALITSRESASQVLGINESFDFSLDSLLRIRESNLVKEKSVQENDASTWNYFNIFKSAPKYKFSHSDVNFFLYTRSINNPKEITLDRLSFLTAVNRVSDTNFDPSRRTKFIIHGWYEHCEVFWNVEMRHAILEYEDANVICVDWNLPAVQDATESALLTKQVGISVAFMILSLIEEKNALIENIHLISFSMGAHAAGYAGHVLRNLGIENLGRITALDPPLWYFEYDDTRRLQQNDATFVDVVHTDGDTEATFDSKVVGISIHEPVGDVDFYPNGGVFQKGCSNVLTEQLYARYFVNMDIRDQYCNHKRAVKYFSESVKNPVKAYPCSGKQGGFTNFGKGLCFSDPITFGYHAVKPPKLTEKKYYILTNPREPLLGTHYRVKLKHSCLNNGNDVPSTKATIKITLFSKQAAIMSTTCEQAETNINKIIYASMTDVTFNVTFKRSSLNDFDSVKFEFTSTFSLYHSSVDSWSLDSVIFEDSSGIRKSVHRPIILREDAATEFSLTSAGGVTSKLWSILGWTAGLGRGVFTYM